MKYYCRHISYKTQINFTKAFTFANTKVFTMECFLSLFTLVLTVAKTDVLTLVFT